MAQFTKYTGTIDGTVGSLITVLDAILVTGEGWTKDFTGTNKAVYRAPTGNRLYLRVQDDGPGTHGGREARMTGYETMSDVDTGTGPFPTAAQGAGSIAMVVCRKSSSADSVARNYKAWVDERTIMLFIEAESLDDKVWRCFMFGEFYSFVSSDSYRTAICGRSQEATSSSTAERLGTIGSHIGVAGAGFFVARGHSGAPGSVLMGRHGDSSKSQSSFEYKGIIPFPNPVDGGLYFSRTWLHDIVTSPTSQIRGRLRGLWIPLHQQTNFNDGDIFAGTGDLSGKSFEMVKNFYQLSNAIGVAAIETSDTLETN